MLFRLKTGSLSGIASLFLLFTSPQIFAQETVDFMPRLLVSQTHFALSTCTACNTPQRRSFSWTPNGKPIELSAEVKTDNGGDWLSIEAQNGQPLPTFQITATRGSLGPGTYTAKVILRPDAADIPPKELDVSFLIYVSEERNRIFALSTEEVVWGQTVGIVASAAGSLSGLRDVKISPSDGLEITGVEISSRAVLWLTVWTASFRVKVHDGAPEVDRLVTLTGTGGETNSLTLRVRRPNPFIVSSAPQVFHPGRLYFSKVHPSGTPQPFVWNGIDLNAIDSVSVAPSDLNPFAALGLYPSATTINGYVLVDPNAPLGPGRFEFLAPFRGGFGTPFTIESPPAQAPEISDMTLQESSTQPGFLLGGTVTYRGTCRFKDLDGDVSADTMRIRMAVLVSNSSLSYSSAIDVKSSPNATITIEGDTIAFTIRVSYSLSLLTARGVLPVALAITDAAGNLSNTLVIEKSTWHIPVS